MGVASDFIEIFRFVDLFKTFRSEGKDDVENLITILENGKSKYSRWEAAEALGPGETDCHHFLVSVVESRLNRRQLCLPWKDFWIPETRRALGRFLCIRAGCLSQRRGADSDRLGLNG